jgi:hypothetical protein
VFYDEDLRFDYMMAFKNLTKCLNVVFPARQALDYMGPTTRPSPRSMCWQETLPRRTSEHERHPSQAACHN